MDKKKVSEENEKAANTQDAAKEEAMPVEKAHHIVELLVENIMKVRVAHIKPKGNVIQLTGRNGQGKTSVLNAIAWALTGTADIPSQPIRAGQRVGAIKMDLGDLVVTRHFTRIDPDKSSKGNTYITKLMIEGKHRERFHSPQTILNSLMGKISFDPLAFTRMDDKEQLDTMRGLVRFDIDIDALDAQQAIDYEDRKVAGRDFDAAESRVNAAEVPVEGLPERMIDTSIITKRMSEAANHNSIVAAQRQKKAQFETEIAHAKSKAAWLRDEAEGLLAQAALLDGISCSVHEEEERLPANKVDTISALSAEIALGEDIDVAELVKELNSANVTNRAISIAASYAAVKKEFEEAQAKWKALDDGIKARELERAAAIARAKMPIDGLSIGDGEVLYKGLPFRQASNAEQIRVSMALAMTSNPKLRVLRIADGSLLDSESLMLISQEADKNGFQVWIERVDTGGAVGVLMEEGEASGDEVVVDTDKAKVAK